MRTWEDRRHDGDHHTHNAASMVRMAVMGGAALFGASFAPPGLALAVMSSLLLIGAMASGFAAIIVQERVWEEHLTRWDEAAALFLLSGIASAFVDAAALGQATPG
ncbi:MAG: hypothetical protein H6842_01235 [Rhodospirillaceae bacterium]|nr:hypothetical protein [Rhodospirillaceae bacterium]